MSKKFYERAIARWPEEDRLREKLLKYGSHTANNAELLAIGIRKGLEGSSAIGLERELFRRFETLLAMSAWHPAELPETKGLSRAKIDQIMAAVERGRRMISKERALEDPIRSFSDLQGLLSSMGAPTRGYAPGKCSRGALNTCDARPKA